MTEDNDVPDYMSDEFLGACVPQEDVRPGLLHRQAEKRKHEQLKKRDEANAKNKDKNKSRRQLEEDQRQEGLSKEITPDNKGFQLLQKMGYKPGASIGKSEDGMKNPIAVEVKTNRTGLGHKTLMQEKKIKLDLWKQKRDEEQQQLSNPKEFRQRIQIHTALKETDRDLKKAQLACRNLDIQAGKLTSPPSKPWFWPEIPKPEEDGDLDGDETNQPTPVQETEELDSECPELEPQEKLQMLVEYLREGYLYCIWCGTNYDDIEDLLQSCPGITRDDH